MNELLDEEVVAATYSRANAKVDTHGSMGSAANYRISGASAATINH